MRQQITSISLSISIILSLSTSSPIQAASLRNIAISSTGTLAGGYLGLEGGFAPTLLLAYIGFKISSKLNTHFDYLESIDDPILTTLKECSTENELLEKIKRYYIDEPFPYIAAFEKLSTIKQKITAAEKHYTLMYLINEALLTLKAYPDWQQQVCGHNLKRQADELEKRRKSIFSKVMFVIPLG